MLTQGSSDHDATQDLSSPHRRPPAERLRLLAQLWPSFDDEERALLEGHVHRLREKASV